MNLFNLLFAVCAGALFALQVVVNSQARSRLMVGDQPLHPFQASLINFAGGTILLAIICLVFRFPWPAAATVRQSPAWIWTGGVLGIVYIFSSVLLAQRLGVGQFMALIVAGLMIGSMLLDHFGALGAPVKPVNLGRLLGVALVIGGATVIALSTQSSPAVLGRAAETIEDSGPNPKP